MQVERENPYAPPLAVSATGSRKRRGWLTRIAVATGWFVAWFVFAIAFRIVHFVVYHETRFSEFWGRLFPGIPVDQWVLATALVLLPFAAGFGWGTGRLLDVGGPLSLVVAVTGFLLGCGAFEGTPTTEPRFAIVFAMLAAAAIASTHRWRPSLPTPASS